MHLLLQLKCGYWILDMSLKSFSENKQRGIAGRIQLRWSLEWSSAVMNQNSKETPTDVVSQPPGAQQK